MITTVITSAPIEQSRFDFSFMRHKVRRTVLQLMSLSFALIGLSYFNSAQAAACFEEAGAVPGAALCREPTPSAWSVNYCPMTGTFAYIEAAECRAAGGTWNGIYNGCSNYTLTTEFNLLQQVSSFWQLESNNPSCGLASDTGWGQTLPNNILCWQGPPIYQNNLLIKDNRILNGTCWPTVYAIKSRSLSCPIGYTSNTLANGDKVCVRPVECNNCTEGDTARSPNPITYGSGIKVAEETDYQASGLQLTRYYNSMYFFVPRAAAGDEPRDMGSNWRTNYSKRIYPITNSAYVSAATTYPSGEVQYFNASGDPVVHYGKSKVKLINTGSGYQLKKADNAVEYYDVAGKLLSIQTLGGYTQTLIYSDGTDGVQSGQGGYLLDAATGNPSTIVMPTGLLLRVVDSFGRALNFGYDNLYGRLVKVYLPDGGAIRYQYDSNANLTQVIQSDNTQRTYLYNEPSNRTGTSLPNALTGIVDENSVRIASYFYDSLGRAVSEVQPGNGVNANSYSLSFGANSTTVTDPLGVVRTYQFANNLILRNTGVTQPAASGSGTVSSSKVFDANHNVISRTDFNGLITTYDYDSTRNVEISRTEASGTPQARTITTQWHPTFQLPTQIDEPGKRTVLGYDGSGNLLSKTDTDTATNTSLTWNYTYNSYGQVLTADGPRTDATDITTYTYYSCTSGYQCGQLQSITDAAGNQTSYLTYNANGQPLTISDANGTVTTLTYDTRQRLKTRTVGADVTTFDYYPTGLLQKATMPDGNFIQYTYDGAHRLTGIADNEGNRIAYTLDAAGNRLSETVYDPSNILSRTHNRLFDQFGRVYQEIGAANQTVTYSYDNQGNVLTTTDPSGRVSASSYDVLNRLQSITDPMQGVVQYGYDSNDNLTSVQDPKALATNYAYNGLGELTEQQSPDTQTTNNTYDSAGNLKTSTDARSKTATYTHDALNRATQVSYSDQTIQYTYDQGINGKGRLNQVTDSSGQTSWSYDSQGRITSRTQVIGSITKTTS